MAIPEILIQQLEAIAKDENRSAAEVLEYMLRTYPRRVPLNDPPLGSLAALAKNAIEADLHSGVEDTAERSREILDHEFGDYLKRQIDRDTD